MKQSLVGVLALVGTLAACSGSTSPTDSNAKAPGTGSESRVPLRFVNAGLIGGSTNLYVNSALTIQGTAFSSVGSGSLLTSSVPQTVTVALTGDPRLVLASKQITFAADTPYTMVFMTDIRSDDTLDAFLVYPDTVSAPALDPSDTTLPPGLGAASFRIVHVAANAGLALMDVYRTTGSADLSALTPMASNVAFGALSPHVSYPAGSTRIIVTMHGDPSSLLYDSGTRTVSAGEAWSIFLTRAEPYLENGEYVPRLSALWVKDRG